MSPIKTTLADFWLEYRNDFLTVARFAAYHEISESDANELIALGCRYHQERCDQAFAERRHQALQSNQVA